LTHPHPDEQEAAVTRGDGALAPVLTDAADLPGALATSGTYTVAADGTVQVPLLLRRDGALTQNLTPTGDKDHLDGDGGLVAKIVAAIDQAAENAAATP
jgi:hypothetical protein